VPRRQRRTASRLNIEEPKVHGTAVESGNKLNLIQDSKSAMPNQRNAFVQGTFTPAYPPEAISMPASKFMAKIQKIGVAGAQCFDIQTIANRGRRPDTHPVVRTEAAQERRQ
jgi:hypothetical protein